MELLELLLSIPELLELFVYAFRALWWLVKGLGALVVLAGRGLAAAGRAIGRSFYRLLGWLRDRERARDFPTASVVTDRADRADRANRADRADRADPRADRAHRADPRLLL